MRPSLLASLQVDPLLTPPGVLGALLVVAVVILVGRIVLRFAWRIVVFATIAAAVLWALAVVGGLGGFLGM